MRSGKVLISAPTNVCAHGKGRPRPESTAQAKIMTGSIAKIVTGSILKRASANSLTPIDRLFAAASIRCQLVFPSNDARQCSGVLRKGLKQLIATLPSLSHHVTIPPGCNSLDSIKIEPPSSFVLEQIMKVKNHETPLREAIKEGNKNKAQFDTDFMPIAMVPDMEQPIPVLGFQVNIHPDGVLLAVAANHMVMDGTGMGVAIENLANCCRRLDGKDVELLTSTAEQDRGREMLMHQLPAKSSEQEFPEYRVAKDLFGQWTEMAKHASHANSSIQSRYLNIRTEDVRELKDRCNEMLPHVLAPGDTSGWDGLPWVSSSDVVIALIWLSLNRARSPELANKSTSTPTGESGESEDIRVGMAVNIRSRVSPPLPKSYMGNGAILMLATYGREAAASPERMEALCRMAYAIRRKLTLQRHLQSAEDPVVFAFEVANFFVTNLRDMEFCSADFGSKIGKPQHSRISDSPADGCVYIMPKRTHVDNDPWEIQVAFTSDVLKRMEQDSLWTRYIHADPFWS
ncbi:hypothetical protein ACN42_g7537 [Penicillium freii]|uniref:Uncharacterized protein n=1 Tax=Penicillium freii TaxID=48697 RepID=A0A117NMP9_PENFR|nr:hypothetical protein ACN42_g7537 [Penicillium freii]